MTIEFEILIKNLNLDNITLHLDYLIFIAKIFS
jgi:hypothetical protein